MTMEIVKDQETSWAPPAVGDFEYIIVRQEGDLPIPCDACRTPKGPWYLAFYYGSLKQYEEHMAPLVFVICSGCCTRINKMTDTCTDCIPDPSAERICDNCGKIFQRKAPGWVVPTNSGGTV